MHNLDSNNEVWTLGSNFAIALARVFCLVWFWDFLPEAPRGVDGFSSKILAVMCRLWYVFVRDNRNLQSHTWLRQFGLDSLSAPPFSHPFSWIASNRKKLVRAFSQNTESCFYMVHSDFHTDRTSFFNTSLGTRIKTTLIGYLSLSCHRIGRYFWIFSWYHKTIP